MVRLRENPDSAHSRLPVKVYLGSRTLYKNRWCLRSRSQCKKQQPLCSPTGGAVVVYCNTERCCSRVVECRELSQSTARTMALWVAVRVFGWDGSLHTDIYNDFNGNRSMETKLNSSKHDSALTHLRVSKWRYSAIKIYICIKFCIDFCKHYCA